MRNMSFLVSISGDFDSGRDLHGAVEDFWSVFCARLQHRVLRGKRGNLGRRLEPASTIHHKHQLGRLHEKGKY